MAGLSNGKVCQDSGQYFGPVVPSLWLAEPQVIRGARSFVDLVLDIVNRAKSIQSSGVICNLRAFGELIPGT